MTLLELSVGAVAEILSFQGGVALAERLQALGIFAGTRVRVLKMAPFRGPFLIEDVKTGARIMIGRGMADRIEVWLDDKARP